ncbi:MAG: hypothetical protein JWO32_3176, partial [Bacteroidetes bacterium]|nr:hypothetical protein [Bacteroidota bacterium]
SGAGAQSGVGSISASTYPTNVTAAVNNRPLPSGVNNLLNNCGTEHAKKMLDRFWVINANNYISAPSAIKKLTYLDDEWNTANASTNLITEPLLNTWYNTSGPWVRINSSNNSGLNEQSIPNSSNYGIYTLGEYKKLNLALVNVDSVKCFGQSNGVIEVAATNGYGSNVYSWNSVISTDSIKTNLPAGTYTIIAIDAMGCSDTVNNILVFQPSLLSQTLTANDRSICKNQFIKLNSAFTGGIKPYTLSWSTGASSSNVVFSPLSINASPALSTQYTATLTDKNNCTNTATILINVNQLPVVNFDSDVKNGCQPLQVNFQNLSAASPSIASFLWSFLQGSSSSVVNPNVIFNNPGSYNVTLKATSDSGCVNTLTKNNFITVYEKPQADFLYTPLEDANILDPKIDFQNTSTGNYVNSLWSFGDGATSGLTNPSHSYDYVEQFNVRLVVSTVNNCTDTVIKVVDVKDAPAIYIPNAFTPFNGDGLNDVFTVKGINFYDFKMKIFDRWGEEILETTDNVTGWDGTYKGARCQVGVYIYKVSFRNSNGFQNGTPRTITGHVMLMD